METSQTEWEDCGYNGDCFHSNKTTDKGKGIVLCSFPMRFQNFFLTCAKSWKVGLFADSETDLFKLARVHG